MSVIDRMGKKVDHVWVGVVFALVIPVIAFFVFWKIKYSFMDAERLYYYMSSDAGNRKEMLVMPLIPNMVAFYFSNFQWRWDRFTVGLVATTLVLVVPIVIVLL